MAPLIAPLKVFQVLGYLLAHRVVVWSSKQESLQHLWPDQFVGDAALTSCVRCLRRGAGGAGRTPRFLHTLHSQDALVVTR